ncbi:MAG TPA: SPFH domain-containing protein [Thermoanaerobaculia bacterium]|nr:SPFH domain-containing protein [Thermoanaerobaculia bacterium]
MVAFITVSQFLWAVAIVLALAASMVAVQSLHRIGPDQVGLVTKRASLRRLANDDPIAFDGEAGYQADLLMPGVRWKSILLYRVEKFPWAQVPAGEIGVVIAQVGRPLPIGAKSAVYREKFGDFSDVRAFVEHGGQKGVQRPVLPPGTLLPIHPIAFLVITKERVFGRPISAELQGQRALSPRSFGLDAHQLDVVRIEPERDDDGEITDMIGIVTTYEGDPLPAGDIANRIGGFSDIEALEAEGSPDARIIEAVLGSKNDAHNNYQDFQRFLDRGGRIGLQHDPLLYGGYTLNPFLVSVERVSMLVVQQGQVAVVKSFVGLPTKDTSGSEFTHGSLVRPGHRGIWQEALRTGKYAINPRCYQAEIVPTSILTLNWANAVSQAHKLDERLQQIEAKSREGFVFKIDLQVQIHVPDTEAPYVISIVGTMKNLVNEVLQAAVGNHFRDKLQSMPAITFIETRQEVQQKALAHIKEQLSQYRVATKGVYIQDVVLPADMVAVLTQREIASQEIETFQRQQEAQRVRIEMEKAKGTADMQARLAQSQVGVDIKTNESLARKAEADGEAEYIRETGRARSAEIEAVGLARAKGYDAQQTALGREATAIVNAIEALGRMSGRLVPEVLSINTNGGGTGSLEGVASTLMSYLHSATSNDAKRAQDTRH